MSTVLSVKVSRDFIGLTNTADTPEKRIHREQKFRPQLRKGQDTIYEVCSEDLVLGSDPATGKNLSVGNQLTTYSDLCRYAGIVYYLSTR